MPTLRLIPMGCQERANLFSWVGGNRIGFPVDDSDDAHITDQDQNHNLKYATNADGNWNRRCIFSQHSPIAVADAGRVRVTCFDPFDAIVKVASGLWEARLCSPWPFGSRWKASSCGRSDSVPSWERQFGAG